LRLHLLGVLKQVVEATPLGKKTFLEKSHGERVSSNGFGDWFRDRCDETGCHNVWRTVSACGGDFRGRERCNDSAAHGDLRLRYRAMATH
jgi:hypothetical protein